jgi:RimJ/RimL family protein N-acetyltransferase
MAVAPVTLELEGGLVRLEPLRPRHAEGLLDAGTDDSVWTYLMEHPRTLADMHAFIARALAAERSGRELPFATVDTATGRAIGSTRYEDITPNHRTLEIGWTWLGLPWQRTARNTQCKFLLFRHAFETLGAVRVQLKADTRNHRSLRAIERLGAVYEGTLRKNRILPDGFVRDSAYFSITAEEWPAIKARLQRGLRPATGDPPHQPR